MTESKSDEELIKGIQNCAVEDVLSNREDFQDTPFKAELLSHLAKGRAAMELLKEIDDYLKPNPKNYIGTGSILHQKVQEIVTRKERKK